jgi:transposase
MLSISRWTLYRWKKQWELNGSTQPSKSVPPPHPSKITDWDKFKNFIDNNKDKTQKELAQMWGGVSHNTISMGLKKLGYTRKKTYGYQERNELERKAFLEKIASDEPEQLIYMDESGINNNEVYEYGWNEKGSRYYSKKPGVRARNVSA